MQIRIRHDHYIHSGSDNEKLDNIISKLIKIEADMAKSKTDFDALSARFEASHIEISDALTNVADDVRRLTEGLTPTGGLTEAEATEVFDAIEAKAIQIEAVAVQVRALANQTPEDPQP